MAWAVFGCFLGMAGYSRVERTKQIAAAWDKFWGEYRHKGLSLFNPAQKG